MEDPFWFGDEALFCSTIPLCSAMFCIVLHHAMEGRRSTWQLACGYLRHGGAIGCKKALATASKGVRVKENLDWGFFGEDLRSVYALLALLSCDRLIFCLR